MNHSDFESCLSKYGIFQVDFSESGLCEEFREWTHSDEEIVE
jgi:hypothetical protein